MIPLCFHEGQLAHHQVRDLLESYLDAAGIAAHEFTRTTGLYDRRSQEVELAEIERIRI